MHASKTNIIIQKTIDVNKSGANCTDSEIESDSVRFNTKSFYNDIRDNQNYISWLLVAFRAAFNQLMDD